MKALMLPTLVLLFGSLFWRFRDVDNDGIEDQTAFLQRLAYKLSFPVDFFPVTLCLFLLFPFTDYLFYSLTTEVRLSRFSVLFHMSIPGSW